MLDRDLAQLAAGVAEMPPAGLEQAIWSKVEALQRARRFERLASRVQLVTLIVVLAASTTLGIAITRARTSPAVMQLSSLAADLAPSTLLDAPPEPPGSRP